MVSTGATKPSQGWAELLERPSADEGPLKGLTFAVKDMYQVEGHTNGCGNPKWKVTHGPADRSAGCVDNLLASGAQLVGMTQMDELAFSLNGENVHYGTPVNAAAQDRVPGGSSSGSASVVAWGEVDFAVGSDTAGSVRIPASYQGIFGHRPTHARIDMSLATPLAPSFDTCGWFARDAETLQKVGRVLMPDSTPCPPLTRWLVAKDAFDTAPDASAAIYAALSADFDGVKGVLGEPTETDITLADTPGLASLQDWLGVFRTLQSAEVWSVHGEWVSNNEANFGPGIRERFTMASQVPPEAVSAAKAQQASVRAHLDSLLGADGFIALPSAPGAAPVKACPAAELEDFRTRALALTCPSGLGGYPQVTLPIGMVDGCPVGLSLMGPRNSDTALLELATRLMRVLVKVP